MAGALVADAGKLGRRNSYGGAGSSILDPSLAKEKSETPDLSPFLSERMGADKGTAFRFGTSVIFRFDSPGNGILPASLLRDCIWEATEFSALSIGFLFIRII